MSADRQNMHVIVVADDNVDAGMLALDLVQTGLNAQAAADEDAVLVQLATAIGADPSALPGLVAAYDNFNRISVLSRRVISAGARCRFIAVAHDRDRSLAEAEADLLGWAGFVAHPVSAEAVAALLREAPSAASESGGDAQEGSLATTSALQVLQSLLVDGAPAANGRDAVLQVADNQRHGQVAIVDGAIVHAQADMDTGRHALERICCWRSGSWRIARVRYTGERTIRNGAAALPAAREYARRVVAARESMPHLHDVCVVRWERVRPLPVAAEAMFQRIAAGVPLQQALSGPGDDELEAYAAVVSRIRRGAVTPRDMARPTRQMAPRGSGSGGSVASRSPTTGFHTAQGGSFKASAIVGGRLDTESAGALARSSSMMRRVQPSAEDARTRRIAPEDIPTDLPDVPRRRSPKHTPSRAILPATLPEFESDGLVPVDVSATTQPGGEPVRTTGWFGLNVGPERTAPAATPAAVVPPASVPPMGPAPTVNVTEQVANLPRKRIRQSTDMIKAAYSDWSDDYAATERAVEEASVVFQVKELQRPARGRGLMWLAALVVVAGAGAAILVPEWGLFGAATPLPAKESPVMGTYRRAVALANEGRRAESVALLSGIRADKAVPAEALLQLAVLEIELERYELARTHLQRYLEDPRSLDVQRAKRLFGHVFGKLR